MNKVGFGFLRLPRIDETDEHSVDFASLNEMVDAFFANGGDYFDTAYTYLSGTSETALRESVVRRYPRESFRIADKLPVWLLDETHTCESMFAEQLARCGVDYFDTYLLHGLNEGNCKTAEKYNVFDFLQRMKAEGKARKIGFSFHDTAEVLERILAAHPEMDYVQLQLNYLDWESTAVQSRLCYETAVRHGKAVIVMEPVKGGTLAALDDEARAKFAAWDAAPDARWAMRFVHSLENVEIVLSGMTSIAQIEENRTEIEPLDEVQTAACLAAAEILRGNIAIACTACDYCAEGCPSRVAISRYFKLYNEYSRTPADLWKMRRPYFAIAEKFGKASDCIGCGACEAVCPQKLPIIDWLKKTAEAFENSED